jgi:hypothetical protein
VTFLLSGHGHRDGLSTLDSMVNGSQRTEEVDGLEEEEEAMDMDHEEAEQEIHVNGTAGGPYTYSRTVKRTEDRSSSESMDSSEESDVEGGGKAKKKPVLLHNPYSHDDSEDEDVYNESGVVSAAAGVPELEDEFLSPSPAGSSGDKEAIPPSEGASADAFGTVHSPLGSKDLTPAGTTVESVQSALEIVALEDCAASKIDRFAARYLLLFYELLFGCQPVPTCQYFLITETVRTNTGL